MTMGDVSTPAFWEERYATGADGWELGRAAPPLVDFIESTPPPRGRVAVPGIPYPTRKSGGVQT